MKDSGFDCPVLDQCLTFNFINLKLCDMTISFIGMFSSLCLGKVPLCTYLEQSQKSSRHSVSTNKGAYENSIECYFRYKSSTYSIIIFLRM